MPTVMLTAKCMNSCEWCFAQTKMEKYHAQGIDEISWEDFQAVVAFYGRSGMDYMTLLGGEPTLHSRFVDILELLASKQFAALVVTYGICDEVLVDIIAQKRFPGIRFAVNTTKYFQYPTDVRKKVDRLLQKINHSVFLTYTITSTDVERGNVHVLLDRILMVMKFGLLRHIQFQIAIPSENNTAYVPFEDYSTAVRMLSSWFKILNTNGITTGLDCHSIPKCALEGAEKTPIELHSRCSSFMIDIGPGLEVWPCFPLSGQNFRLGQFKDFKDMQAFFAKIHSEASLLYDERCSNCSEQASGTCDAGCRGFQILRNRIQKETSAPRRPVRKEASLMATEVL